MAFCFLALAGVLQARAGTMVTLSTNGPTANRLNLVFLSEGYTSAELPRFLVDATNSINTLLANDPFQQ